MKKSRESKNCAINRAPRIIGAVVAVPATAAIFVLRLLGANGKRN